MTSFFSQRLACLLWFFVGLMPLSAQDSPQVIPKSPETLVIVAEDGAQHSFAVEIALTPQQQATGLMFREDMADSEGMLFPFARPRRASFWMRNTLISLDLVFIRRNGKIANIIRGAQPLSEDRLLSKGQVAAVLELRGGLTSELGIKAGDRVYHSVLGQKAPTTGLGRSN